MEERVKSTLASGISSSLGELRVLLRGILLDVCPCLLLPGPDLPDPCPGRPDPRTLPATLPDSLRRSDPPRNLGERLGGMGDMIGKDS